jgi:hypothetical protein
VTISLPTDNMIVMWGGAMTLIGNSFFSVGQNPDGGAGSQPPLIGCGAVYLAASNSTPATVFSLNNSFSPFPAASSYAPFVIWAPPFQVLTGPGSWGASQRLSVWSVGDVGSTTSGLLALQPWLGVTPNAGATVTIPWSPTVQIGAAAWISTTIQLANPGDAVVASYDHALPGGAILTAAVSGQNTLTATLLNMTGATLSPAGNVIFTVWPRT